MNIFEKRRMAMTGDESRHAVGRRLKAARLALGLRPEDILPEFLRMPDAQAILQAEEGARMPERFHLGFFEARFRIKREFFTEGEVSLIPADVELRLFFALSSS